METIINIVGGVALLLWGIRMVRTGITRSFGADLRHALAASARNRVTGLAAGFGVTTILQSSTATALIVSSFAGQGLIAGVAALAIMLGADVGSTMIVQALSLNLNWLSPVLISIGVFLFLSTENSRRRAIARALIGLGLMLLSLRLIALGSLPFRESEAMAVLVGPLTSEPLLAIVFAAALTWASHSSVAVVLLIMSLAGMQVLNVQLAMTMVLGANLGGALAAVGLTAKALPAVRRVPIGNLLMRMIGVFAVLPLVPYLQPYLAVLGDTPERLLANFHTGFNLALVVLFLPALALVDWAARRIAPDRPATDDPGSPRYLDEGALDTPSVALTGAARETLRMGDAVKAMLSAARDVLRTNDATLRKTVEAQDDVVDRLHEAIKLYLTRLTEEEMDKAESQRSIEILSFTTNLEHVGDIIDKNLMELAGKKIKGRISFSDEGQRELEAFHNRILQNLDLALHVFVSADEEAARRLLHEKTEIRDLERRYVENHFRRMGERRPDTLDSSSLHLDVLRDLKRVNSHLTSVAYPILERLGALTESRLIDETEPSREDAVPPLGAQPRREDG
ncbi:MAG: sodium:phosphate symporter [Rhodospirillaceae bacterium]|nr:sodium:phosphate symporter [Rhodospirillaceae bacterium]